MAKLKVYVKNNQTEVKVPVGIRLLIRKDAVRRFLQPKISERMQR